MRHTPIHGLRHSCRYMHFPQGSIQLNTFRASVFRCLPFRKILGGRRSPPPPRGQHRLRLLPLSASLPLPRGRGAQSSVWLSRAPRRGMASCKGRRVIIARRPTEGAAHSCEIAFRAGPPCGHVGSDRSLRWRASRGRSPERRSAALWLSWSKAAVSRRAQWKSMDGCDRLLL